MIHSVIMAGGVGARFWPLSRKHKPKQMLDFFGDGVLIRQTVARIEPLVSPENRWIVTNREQMQALRGVLPEVPEEQYVLEPVGRNTAPAIGLSAVHLLRRDPDAVMVVLPADHRIEDVAAFQKCLQMAIDLVAKSDYLATIGIHPVRPETGYGYIQMDRSDPPLADGVYPVKTFAEKPNLQTAKLFIETGEFLWNSGIFVWRADVIMRQIADHMPEWYSGLQEIAAALGTDRESQVTQHVFAALRGISIDYGVMEHAPRVAVVKGEFGWSDVGSWDQVWRLLAHDAQENSIQGNAVLVEASRNLVLARDRLIAVVGINDLCIVDAGDAILICPRDESQQVRAVVSALEKSGREQYL